MRHPPRPRPELFATCPLLAPPRPRRAGASRRAGTVLRPRPAPHSPPHTLLRMAEKSREALRALMEAKRLERLKSRPVAAASPAAATLLAAAAPTAAAGLQAPFAPKTSATRPHGRASSHGLGELLRSRPRSVSATHAARTPRAPSRQSPSQSAPSGLDLATELAKHIFGHAVQPAAARKRRPGSAAADEQREEREQLCAEDTPVTKVLRSGEP
jgi:hypothetical protein